MVPLLPGFVRAVKHTANGNGWDHIYEISYFYGFFVALVVHAVLHTVFPAKRQRGSSPFVLSMHAETLERVEGEEGRKQEYTSSKETEAAKP